ALLAGNRPEQPARLLLLRYKVLSQLAALPVEEGSTRSPEELSRLALRCAEEAAGDPALVEAQEVMLTHCFRTDRLSLAEPYARNWLQAWAERRVEGARSWEYELGARHVLAWIALNRPPARPDEAIAHLARADELEEQLRARGTT